MSRAGVSAAVAVAACGTATLAAGCGGSASATPCSPGTSAGGVRAAGAPRHLSVVGAAAVKTEQAGSSRFTMRTGGSAASFTMSGLIDYRRERALMELSASAGGTDIGGQIRLVGHCEYIEATAFGTSVKKPWASVDLNRILPAVGGANGNAPGDSLQELQASGSFHRVGVRDVRGVRTTLYRGTLDLVKASAKLPKRLREELQKLHATVSPASAWIDRSGFLRKMTTSVSGVDVTIEYYDFGVPVKVTAPAPDTVQDVTAKFKSVLGA